MKKILTTVLLILSSTQTHALKAFPLGTGDLTGNYYPTGSAICRILNKSYKTNNLRCYPVPTRGSIENLNSLKITHFNFALSQSDVVYQAIKAQGQFKNKGIHNLRSIMAIYPELLTLVVRKDSKIKTLQDIIGKKINIGHKGSGTEASVLNLFKYNDIKRTSIKFTGQILSSNLPSALKEKKIDGYFYMAGHPSGNIKIAQNATEIRLISFTNKNIKKLLEENSFYAKGKIKAAMYKNNPNSTHTFGVKSVLLSTKESSEEEVYLLTKTLIENLEVFKKQHPIYSNISKESLIKGLVAPLHKGAKRYYKEIGLIYE